MRIVRLEHATSVNPRQHYLVVLTPESLSKRPLDVPIFSIVDGRHGRSVASRSEEGMGVLRDGRNVLYVGVSNVYGTPVRNAKLRDVLEGILESLAPCEHGDSIRSAIESHVAELGQPHAAGTAA